VTACEISAVWDKNSGQPPPSLHEFQAIWDTGATNSLISDAVVSNCQLIASGKAESHHAQGSAIVDTYLVNINIPKIGEYPGIRVSEGKPTGGDVLIGMDIIGTGDFAVTNLGGVTKFSFRYPSVEHIDFFQESKIPQFQHGPGRRKKRR
jgi:hypothetical protein